MQYSIEEFSINNIVGMGKIESPKIDLMNLEKELDTLPCLTKQHEVVTRWETDRPVLLVSLKNKSKIPEDLKMLLPIIHKHNISIRDFLWAKHQPLEYESITKKLKKIIEGSNLKEIRKEFRDELKIVEDFKKSGLTIYQAVEWIDKINKLDLLLPDKKMRKEYLLDNYTNDITFSFFKNGKFRFYAYNESIINYFVDCLKKYFDAEMNYKVINRVGTARLNNGIECGILQQIFPNSKKVWGEGISVKFEEGNLIVHPSGKIILTGFKNYDSMQSTLNEAVKSINKDYEESSKKRLNYCRMERAQPMFEAYHELIKTHYSDIFTEEEVVMGKDIGESFLRKMYNERDSFSGKPKNYGYALVYIISRLLHKQISQLDIALNSNVTEITLRNRYKMICDKTGLELPEL